jgi:integrase
VEPRTVENYESLLRNHILPRWRECPIAAVTALDVATWRKALRQRYAASTVDGIMCVFSMMLGDAVDQRMIEVNPVHHKRRRGRRRDHAPSGLEKVWALPEQVVQIAAQAGMLGGPDAELLVITTAWTGCRWGEMTGLQPDHVDLDRAVIAIDPEVGALHESAHGLWLGPPKTPASVREIQLPPFLVDLLREHLAHHTGQFVFTAPQGGWLRRSDFCRRVFRPAVEGDPRKGLTPVRPGLTFHGLRHSHKTWLSTEHVPEIASAKRMGHHLADRLTEVYTHVAPKMERDILTALQRLWRHAHEPTSPVDNRPRTRQDQHGRRGPAGGRPATPLRAVQRRAVRPSSVRSRCVSPARPPGQCRLIRRCVHTTRLPRCEATTPYRTDPPRPSSRSC